MKEVFLALREQTKNGGCLIISGEDSVNGTGICSATFICDAGLIGQYMKEGWHVYRVNGFQRIEEVIVELKMEKKDASSESAQSDN